MTGCPFDASPFDRISLPPMIRPSESAAVPMRSLHPDHRAQAFPHRAGRPPRGSSRRDSPVVFGRRPLGIYGTASARLVRRMSDILAEKRAVQAAYPLQRIEPGAFARRAWIFGNRGRTYTFPATRKRLASGSKVRSLARLSFIPTLSPLHPRLISKNSRRS